MTAESARDEALKAFTEWFVQNYPGPDTIIHEPNWHAPKIFRAVEAALARQRPGWVWVPEVLTKEMRIAATNVENATCFGTTQGETRWAAVLAAAPKPGEGT
jgi:hypothetical protein